MIISQILPWDQRLYDDAQLKNMIENYLKLGYPKLLSDITRCTNCRNMPEGERPYNILANDLGTMGEDIDDALERLKDQTFKFRRYIEDLPKRGKDHIEVEELSRLVYEEYFGTRWDGYGGYGPGLSVGLNPWTDYCLSLWNPQIDRCGILGIEKDWYPLNATLEVQSVMGYHYHEGLRRYTKSRAWPNFWGHMMREHPIPGVYGHPQYSRHFISRYNVVFTNSMACIKHGEERSGDEGTIMECAERCNDHLAKQIELLRPRIILPMGRHAHRSIFTLLEDRWESDSQRIVDELVDKHQMPKLSLGFNRLSQEYDDDDSFVGLKTKWPTGEEMVVIPLYQTSRPSNRWTRDYQLLKRAIDTILNS